MTISIFSNGKEYISASRAGELVGYTSDYVGQLCRNQKIPSKLIGRTWYVELKALEEHRRTRQLGKPRIYKNIAKALDESSAKEVSIGESSSANKNQTSFAVSLASRSKYEEEDPELFPSLSKKKISVAYAKKGGSKLKDLSLATAGLIAAVVTGISALEQGAPDLAYSLETRAISFSEKYLGNSLSSLTANSLGGIEKIEEGDLGVKALEIRLSKEEIRDLLLGKSPN